MSLALRQMSLEDLSDVMQVENASYSIPWSQGVMKGCLRMGYDAWVGEVDQVIRSHAIIQMMVDEAHLLNLCVHPAFQRSGYGQDLLTHVIQRSTELGAHRMILDVRPSNKGAIKLYYALGFERIGVRKGYYPGPEGREDAWVLSLYL